MHVLRGFVGAGLVVEFRQAAGVEGKKAIAGEISFRLL